MFLFLSLSQIVCFLLIQSASSKNLQQISNGKDASIEDLRYMVSIRKRSITFYFGGGHICGGSLIKRDVVLSAAYCYADNERKDGSYLSANEFYLVMGNLDRYMNDNNTVIRDIVKILTYRQTFNYDTSADDIAILYLNDSVPIEHPIIQTITINRVEMPVGTKCHIDGWGTSQTGAYSRNLKTVEVSLVDIVECANSYQSKNISIANGKFCAVFFGGGHQNSCQAYLGSPLVCKKLLYGIVSFGEWCSNFEYPAHFTQVSSYYSWIDENVHFELEENNSQRFEDHYGLIIFLIGSLTLRT